MELDIINKKNEIIGQLSVSDAIWSKPYNEALVHQIVVAYLSNGRGGNRSQLTRAEVKHSTKKPWRQKGTGRARSGMVSTPVWRGGGRAFPNKPNENFSQKINRKMYRVGISVILSQLLRDGRLFVIDDLLMSTPKTKDFNILVSGFGVKEALFVTDKLSEELCLSSRNIPGFSVLEPAQVNPYNLLQFGKVYLTKDAVKILEGQLI